MQSMEAIRPGMGRVGAALLLCLCFARNMAAQDVTWDLKLVDPAAENGSPADLVLPLPCGAGMAFQRVDVPVESGDVLADRPVRLGQSQPQTGYSDYLLPDHLRGPFEGGEGMSAYYIARYEMMAGQYRALNGDCAPPGPPDRLAKGGLSWFDAVDLARQINEWLLANAPDALPVGAAGKGFVRLPTETEWEFAARGGVRIDPSLFPSRLFFEGGDMSRYARVLAGGAASTTPGPTAVVRANPLGLFDIYGNAEELMLEPFRLNAVGRRHGQPGGIVTRGGSVTSTPDQVYSAQRSEYPPYEAATGLATALPTFGVRFVIGAPATQDDARLAGIQSRWIELSEQPAADGADPLSALGELVAAEVDPRLKATLEGIQLEMQISGEKVRSALLDSAKSTLLSGAIFVATLQAQEVEIREITRTLNVMNERLKITSSEQATQLIIQITSGLDRLDRLRLEQRTFLQSFRSVLETLTDKVSAPDRSAARDILVLELGATEQTDLAENLDRFWEDLGLYMQRPDMGLGDLLQMAVDM